MQSHHMHIITCINYTYTVIHIYMIHHMHTIVVHRSYTHTIMLREILTYFFCYNKPYKALVFPISVLVISLMHAINMVIL